MTRLDEIRELFRFNRWAEERMFESVRELSDEEINRDMKNSFASVRETLLHIAAAQWVWLERWKGNSPGAFPEDKKHFALAQIVQWWNEIDAERHALLQSLTEADLDRNITYKNLSGVEFTFPMWQMLRHAVNHNTYHRGEITTMLKQLGRKVISTDMILLYQEEQKKSVNA